MGCYSGYKECLAILAFEGRTNFAYVFLKGNAKYCENKPESLL